ncbi:MAG: leucine-rich repeat protein, partial [Oscillospiraceae bacterium]|nr:leucine-rich repeat protein [Oscillospiraceae bacterium]
LPESLETIGSYTFYGCSGLKEVIIPKNVVDIGKNSFGNCSGLETIELSENLETIGSYAFYGCTKLEDAYFCGDAPDVYGANSNPSFESSVVTIYYIEGKDGWKLDENGKWNGYNVSTWEGPVVETYTVTYNANGGSGTPASQTKTEGEPLTLSKVVPVREGYIFLGWATSASATTAKYQPGDTYTADADITLYAVWQEKVDVKPEPDPDPEPNPDNIDLGISSASLPLGGKATVSVNIEGESNAVAIQFAVKYDTDKLVLESCSAGKTMAELDPVLNLETDGIIIFTWDGLEAFTGEGSILDITFSAKEGAEPQDVEISIVTDENIYELLLADSDFNTIGVNVSNGIISIIDVAYGDINSDGKVNVIDANIARRAAAKLITLDESQVKAADVSGDGKVNVLDANIIRRYAAKLITSFPVEG